MKKIIWLMFPVCSLLSCSYSEQSQCDYTQERMAGIVDARNLLDYRGTYTGIIPGDECKAVTISIVLTKHEYVLRITPLQENAKTVVQRGKYTWDENGSVITLKGVKNRVAKYFVAENQLRQLDVNGKQYKGKNAANYILRKHWYS